MWENEVVHEKELVKRLFLKANTLTDMLSNLKKKGYITISKDENDRRSILISITEKGKDLKKKAVNVPKTLEEEHWLTGEEAIMLHQILYKLLLGDWGA